jgi:hypothetical protein
MSGMTSLLEYPCERPGCVRAFASQHALAIHVGTAHKAGPEPATDGSTRCSNLYCRRPPGHRGRHYPNSASEAKAEPRGRRRRAPIAQAAAPPAAPAPVAANEPVRVVVVQDGVLRLAASELAELAAAVEIGGVRFRVSSAGETLELVPEEAR